MRTAGLFGGLFALVLLQSIAAGLPPDDEGWMLQVATRVADGDVLYRDVWFNTTPLAPGLVSLAVAVFGSQILVLKVVASAVVAAGGTAVAVIARGLGARWAVAALLAATVTLLPGTGVATVYSELAMALAAVVLACVLAWWREERDRLLVLAGVAAGLSFCAKHSTGALTLLALFALLIAARRGLRPLLLAAAGAVPAVLLPIAVVVAAGGGPKLYEYGVSSKGRYVDAASLSYFDGLRELGTDVKAALRSPTDPGAALAAIVQAQFLLPLIAAVALVVAIVRSPRAERFTLAAVTTFAVVAVLNLVPRASIVHIGYATPLIALAIWLALHRAAPERFPLWLTFAVLAIVPTLVTLRTAEVIARDNLVSSSLPHFEHIEVQPEILAETTRTADRLRAARRDGPVFIAAERAGLLYLVAGIENPTPWDYSAASSFGDDGEERLVRDFRSGRIPTVCLGTTQPEDSLLPNVIFAGVRRYGTRGESVGPCTLYRSPRAVG